MARRILIVDDDRVQGAIISGVCSKLGLRSSFASSYQAAADLITAERFDCITIDLSLGDRDGIELLRLIAEINPAPRIIVISGCEERILNATIRMAHGAGLFDAISLPKPIDLSQLRAALSLATPEEPGDRRVPRPASDQVTAADLAHAMELGEIYPAFQPKIDLKSGKVIACEALARWDSPTFGSVGPDVFIPVAETSDLIKPLTLALLREAMQTAQTLLRSDPGFVIAVNLSATLLSDAELPEEIEHLLADAGVPSRALMIEVTESNAMADVNRAMDILLRLRIKGIGLSMDDFGIGYSSLSALARMPFTELKIDRSFVKECRSDPDMWKVVASSVAIAHQYQMKVVAEGIETVDTWQALAELGCDVGQGYVFSKALPRDAFVAWYQEWNERPHSIAPGESHRRSA
ncbi:EAL domain-containing protein [Rhodopseudomonas sp. B29]|uniref:EAL domain-containing response regulator n=1 Tax=Rhodopseudomonas sp. B29 TaxID=95607 RepID=UPI0004CFA437|nr:EAL domain-containing response regulator [Rhodopseudomonas sp. B29]